MEINLDSLKPYIDKKVKEAVNDIKYGFIEVMIGEIIKLQTYKMFAYEETMYIKLDDVMKIFDEYMAESEDNK